MWLKIGALPYSIVFQRRQRAEFGYSFAFVCLSNALHDACGINSSS
jgi:hypothetical protein